MSKRRRRLIELITNVAALQAGGGTPPPPLEANFLSFSMWLNFGSDVFTNQGTVFVVDPEGVYSCNAYCKSPATTQLEIQLLDAGGDLSPNLTKTGNVGPSGVWHSIIYSADTQASYGRLYVDGVDFGGPNPSAGFDMAFEGLPLWFFNDDTTPWDGMAAEIWFAPGQLLCDPGSETIPPATLAKFIDASGFPVDLGSDGSTPTGVAPLVYLHVGPADPAADFASNNGTGGAFTITGGSLSTASSSPSDGGSFAVGAVTLDGSTYLVNPDLG